MTCECLEPFRPGDVVCLAYEPTEEYGCTLKKGHKGPHIACGIGKHNYATWPNDEGEVEPWDTAEVEDET